MKFNYDIKFNDNTPQLHEALDLWAERVLTIWGMTVQDYAQLLVPARQTALALRATWAARSSRA